MPAPHQPESLGKVLLAWSEGRLGEAEFVSLVFENLTPENLHVFRSLVSPDDLLRLESAAADAPTTEQGWGEVRWLQSWCGPWTADIAEQMQGEDKEAISRYRRGVETLRQSHE